MTTLFLIRHGETFANRLNYMQGTLDTKITCLTARGIKQAQSYRTWAQDKKINRVYTSPLKRAYETTQIICANNPLPIIVDKRLTELSYGRWNGKSIVKLEKQYAKYFDIETDDVRPFSVTMSKGESFSHAWRRLRSFLDEVTAQNPKENVLVVTHGWVIKNMVALCLQNTNNFSFKNPRNLSLTKIEIDNSSKKRKVCYYDQSLKPAEEFSF